MKYCLLCIGRRAQDPLISATDGYAKRLGHYVAFELLRLRESNSAQEGALLLARLEPADLVVALDERGTQVQTTDIAAAARSWQERGQRRVVFLIGGADGLDAAVKRRAQMSWGLSRLTLPHRAAQMLLVEQLYRAHTILRGERYHRP